MIGAALFCGQQARAHHAFAATFILDKTVTIEDRVVEFLFRNPHSVVLVETPGKKGQPITWAVEWSNGGQLRRQGVEKDTLKPGDRVIVTGHPSRNPADSGNPNAAAAGTFSQIFSLGEGGPHSGSAEK